MAATSPLWLPASMASRKVATNASIELEDNLVEEDEIFGQIVTLENAVFLMTILSSELAEVFADYEMITKVDLGPEPTRFKAITGYLDSAEKGLSSIRQSLERLSAAPT